MTDVFDDLAKAFKAGLDAGRSESADEIERLRRENQELKLQYLSDQGQWIEETGRLRVALERKQRPEAETIDGVIAWIKEDAERLAKARAALGEKE